MSAREGEAEKVHFRADRFHQSNGQWYYLTRDGVQHGPYATREDAAMELKFYLQKIGVYERGPYKSDIEKVTEYNRQFGAIEPPFSDR